MEDEVTDIQLWLLATKIKPEMFKPLAKRLDFTSTDCEVCLHDHKITSHAVFKLLMKWKNRLAEGHLKSLTKALKKERLMKKFGRKILNKDHVPKPVYTKHPGPSFTNDQLQDYADDIPIDNKIHLGLCLGLKATKIEKIEYDYHGANEVIFQILFTWRNRIDTRVDQRRTLANVMDACDMGRMAGIIRQNHLGRSESGLGIDYALGQETDGQPPRTRFCIGTVLSSPDSGIESEASDTVERMITGDDQLDSHRKLRGDTRSSDGQYELRSLKKGSIHLIFAVYSAEGVAALREDIRSGKLGRAVSTTLLSKETRQKHPQQDLVVEAPAQAFEEALQYFARVGAYGAPMKEWSSDVVQNWAEDVVMLSAPAIAKLSQVDGQLLSLYQKQHLKDDHGLSGVQSTKLMKYRDDELQKQGNAPSEVCSQEDMHGWKPSAVVNWLQDLDFPDDTIRTLADMDGTSLVTYKLEELMEDTGMPLLQGRKLLYMRDKYISCEGGKPPRPLREEVSSSPSSPESGDSASESGMSDRSEALSLEDTDSLADSMLDDSLSQMPDESPISSLSQPGQCLSDGEKGQVEELLAGSQAGFFKSSYFPILIANASYSQASNEFSAENFNFLSNIKWCAVLDCDSTSYDSGLCNFIRHTQPVKIQSFDIFDDVSGTGQLCSDVEFTDVPLWLYVNGRDDQSGINEDKLSARDWVQRRSQAVYKGVRFITNQHVISEKRENVLFLLMSDQDIFIMAELFRELHAAYGAFKYTVLARSQAVFDTWKTELEMRHLIKPGELEGRSIIGGKWRSLNREVERQVGDIGAGFLEIPLQPDSTVPLDRKIQEGWTDITVVGSNMCENTAMTPESPQFKDFVSSHEERFLRGNEVDWWNLYFSYEKQLNHVLDRDVCGKLSKDIRQLQNEHDSRGKPGTVNVKIVTIFHQAGSGATTLAKQMLWKFRKECRCVTVNKVGSCTVEQLASCLQYEYEEKDKTRPLLVLLDNIEPMMLRQLVRDISNHSSLADAQTCYSVILLHPHRCTNASKQGANPNNQPCVFLEHKLSAKEKKWFAEKQSDLEKNARISTPPDKLIGFMAMKLECREEYFERVVRELLPSPNKRSHDTLKLLKYVAVIQKYVPKFALPVTLCDDFKLGGSTDGPWEKRMPTVLQILFTEVTKPTVSYGKMKCVSTVGQKLAKEVVKQIGKMLNESEADMVTELMNSHILTYDRRERSYIKKDLHALFVQRKPSTTGKGKETEFSPFLEKSRKEAQSDEKKVSGAENQEQCNLTPDQPQHEGLKKVYDMMHTAVERMSDPYVAQQLARMYLSDDDCQNALIAIDRALDMNGTNSYFWDTKGRIFQGIMQGRFKESAGIDELFMIFSKGVEAFRRCQELGRTELSECMNLAGFQGEARMIFMFLYNFRDRVSPYNDQTHDHLELQRFLTTAYIPQHIRTLLNDQQIALLKNLQFIVDNAINRLVDATEQCGNRHQNDHAILSLEKNKAKFFPPSLNTDSGDLDVMGQLQGCRYSDVFKQSQHEGATKLANVREMLSKKTDLSLSDLRILTFTSFALFTVRNDPLPSEIKTWVRELQNHESPKTQVHRKGIYGIFFEMLLMCLAESDTRMAGLSDQLQKAWNSLYDVTTPTGNGKELIVKPIWKPPTIEFYLGSKAGKRCLIHKSNVKDMRGVLMRFKGVPVDKYSLNCKFDGSGTPNRIKLENRFNTSPSQEPVSFILSFSFAGLRASQVSSVTTKSVLTYRHESESLPAYVQKEVEDVMSDDSGFDSGLFTHLE